MTARPAASPSDVAVVSGVPSRDAIGPVAPHAAMADAAITGASGRQDAVPAPRHAAVERKSTRSAAAEANASVTHPAEVPDDRGGPRANCGDRNYLSMAVCMDRQCQQALYRSHPQCAEFRRYADARKRSQDQ